MVMALQAAWLAFKLFFGGGKGGIVAAILLGVAVVAVLGGGGWLIANAFTIAGLERDVARAEKATAKAKEDLAVVTANRDGLKMTLDLQSASIVGLQQANAALSREANLRAAVFLANARSETAAIRATPIATVEELNAWFRLQFE